jgi:hypothetical protein
MSVPDKPAGYPTTTTWPEVKRLAAAMASIDRDAVPGDPLARRLHSAVTELSQTEIDALTAHEFAAALSPLHQVLGALEEAPLRDTGHRDLLDLLVRVDDARSMLETADFSLTATDQLASRFRELFTAIVRLRVASARLRGKWRDAVETEEGMS